jgi:hypothetical protein
VEVAALAVMVLVQIIMAVEVAALVVIENSHHNP